MEDMSRLRETLAKDPQNPRALKGAARYYLREGCYKQSQKLYLQAVGLLPRLLPEIILDYEDEIAQDLEKIGPRLSLAGFLVAEDIDGAVLELEELLELDTPSGRQVEAYNVLGRIYIKQEKIDAAIALLERSIEKGIKDVNLSETLAGAYLEKGRIADAVRFYEEILAQKQNDKQILRVLGELYTRLENYHQAALCYQAMFSDDPEVVREVIQRLEDLLKKIEGSVEIREILSDIYVKTLNPEAAVEKLKEVLRLESSKLEDAIQRLKSILKSYPGLPSAVLALAEALRRQGNFSEAVENYYQLVKAKPDFIEEAMRGYGEVLEICPEQVLARAHLGEALISQNKIAEALDEFGKMIEFDPAVADMVIQKCREVLRTRPQFLPAHIVLGQSYLAKGDFQRAALEAEGVIANDPKVASAYILLGEAHFRLNLIAKAANTLHTALMLDPYNLQIQDKYQEIKTKEINAEITALEGRLQGDQWKVSLHLDLARLFQEKGEREKAIRELQVVQKDPLRAPAAYNLLGGIYRGEGRYDLAAAQYNHALELAAPELSKTIRFNLGTTHEAQGQVRKAVRIYEGILQEDIDFGNLKKRVKQLKATSLSSMRNRMLQLVAAELGGREVVAFWGRESRSAGRAGKKEEVNASFGQEHNESGFEYFMKGMYQAAEEEFYLAEQLDRRFGSAVNNFAVSLAKAGKIEEARLKLSEVVAIDPASPVFYNNLGVMYLLTGKWDLARSALEKSAALDPEAAAVCINLGDLFYRKKEIQKAIESWRRVGAFDFLSDIADRRLLHKVPQVRDKAG